jgi:hypothetical protein
MVFLWYCDNSKNLDITSIFLFFVILLPSNFQLPPKNFFVLVSSRICPPLKKKITRASWYTPVYFFEKRVILKKICYTPWYNARFLQKSKNPFLTDFFYFISNVLTHHTNLLKIISMVIRINSTLIRQKSVFIHGIYFSYC